MINVPVIDSIAKIPSAGRTLYVSVDRFLKQGESPEFRRHRLHAEWSKKFLCYLEHPSIFFIIISINDKFKYHSNVWINITLKTWNFESSSPKWHQASYLQETVAPDRKVLPNFAPTCSQRCAPEVVHPFSLCPRIFRIILSSHKWTDFCTNA